ncbi:beta-N-acetylhexosaminidase [Marinilactibacillus sp. XAAS-LB27]|uniref:beta-N-acetylhexosaminidase n=1 Tax=Marinilactibacillus sp. XAAS-LB27 TaxID=3114538 RepID=UPI002E1893D2|nr:beta-N-acetylhexosaminidase [Marinilactibacillus sp. XAAS-LB27]
MIQLNLQGDLNGLEKGLEILKKELEITIDSQGIPIQVVQNKETNIIDHTFKNEEGKITYTTTNNFFRQLNKWIIAYHMGKDFDTKEIAYFDKTGAMIDSSRNAVMNIKGIKEFLRKMAKMGLNQAMLYTEDTYEVEGLPYFGYLRGKYSQEELKELDQYASALGIEMVPCIQTLGHLFQVLQYGTHRNIQDTSDVLLVGEPDTYTFLEKIIEAATAPFQSNKIHIGMDEAFGVGTGRYKQLNGIKNTFEIMNEHVQKVVEITNKLALEPMMWSDMYFRTGSKTGDYYDLKSVVPKEIVEHIPEVDMVFWDYYHEDPQAYKKLLSNHLEMNKKVIFAGGVWTWNGISPNYGKSIETTKVALEACKELGVKEVFATMWGDDGGETPTMAALPGLQVFAHLSYNEKLDKDMLNEESIFNTGLSFDQFLLLNELDETPGVMKNNLSISAGSKILLWQDPLLGKFDKAIENIALNTHYRNLAEKLSALPKDHQYIELFDFYTQLSQVLSTRAEFGLQIKSAYDRNDIKKLNELYMIAENLVLELEGLRKAHRKVWMLYNKPFGWEVLDIRYGGIRARMQTTADRLQDYLKGTLSIIEELEEDKLLLSSDEGMIGRGLYKDIASTGKLSGV